MEPIFKWVGSKRWISTHLSTLIQSNLSPTSTYCEPFAGSAAVFFKVQPERAILCDSVQSLIWTYRLIQTRPHEVWKWMNAVADQADSKENFYLRRSQFNTLLMQGKYTPELAGMFIYLMKAGFNGLWRQNEYGEFNVPFGDHKRILLPTIFDILRASQLLQPATIKYIENPNDTLETIRNLKRGDVVFSDPPYYDTYGGYDGMFVASRDFQERLASTLWQCSLNGVYVYAMNIDCEETRKWYSPIGTIESYKKKSVISGDIKGRQI